MMGVGRYKSAACEGAVVVRAGLAGLARCLRQDKKLS
jgi:hypothetical protein